MFCSLILVLKTLYLYNDIIHLSYQTPPFSVFLYQYLIILLKKNVGNFKNSDLAGKADINTLPKTVHTSITGTGSDYYDISCPGIKYGAAVIAQFASQRNEYYILNADAMADNTVRLRINKAVPAGTGIYVNAIYSIN